MRHGILPSPGSWPARWSTIWPAIVGSVSSSRSSSLLAASWSLAPSYQDTQRPPATVQRPAVVKVGGIRDSTLRTSAGVLAITIGVDRVREVGAAVRARVGLG